MLVVDGIAQPDIDDAGVGLERAFDVIDGCMPHPEVRDDQASCGISRSNSTVALGASSKTIPSGNTSTGEMNSMTVAMPRTTFRSLIIVRGDGKISVDRRCRFVRPHGVSPSSPLVSIRQRTYMASALRSAVNNTLRSASLQGI